MQPARQTEQLNDRGRGRERVAPRRPRGGPGKGWKDIVLRTKNEISKDNASIVSAGVAFYALLSIPFILTAIVSTYGMVADPSEVQRQVDGLAGALPEQARSILSGQLSRISGQAGSALSFALIGSILLALWSGSKGVKALITALNIAYDEQEKRGWVRLNAMILALTFGAVLLAIVAVGLVVGVPALLGKFGLSEVARALSNVLRWPLLAAILLAGLGVIYRYGPSRSEAKWRWLSWGAGIATALWLVGSALFSWYVSSFGNYNEVYGSLGAVVILLMWFYLSAFVVMLGAEIDSEMERQTGEGTAVGGARMSDAIVAPQEKDRKQKKVA